MRETVLQYSAVKTAEESLLSKKRPAPEYVLKVNNMDDGSVSIKLVEKKKSRNPQNLPAIIKKKHPVLRKLFLLLLLFTFFFIISVTIGYNIVFMLFEH